MDGALCYRASGPSGPVAELLKEYCTGVHVTIVAAAARRISLPYAIEREVEDIAALLREAGGSAILFGVSSGAALALDAASCLPGVTKLVLYEAPLIDRRLARADTL